jgi:hypothetical protein
MSKPIQSLFDIRGKVDNVVFYKRYGKTYIRRTPTFKKKRTYTPAQQLAKAKFAISTRFVQRMRTILDETYREHKGKGSVFHKAVGQVNALATIGESLETVNLVPEVLPLSYGSLAPAQSAQLLVLSKAESLRPQELEISWESASGRPNDKAVLIVVMKYVENREEMTLDHQLLEAHLVKTTAKRSEKRVRFTWDTYWDAYEDEVFLYLFFQNGDGSKASTCVFAGKVEPVLQAE